MTGSGESDFAIDRSAVAGPTVVDAVPFSLPGAGSDVAEETVAVLVMTVEGTAAGLTFTTSVKTALPIVNVAAVQVTVPPLPTAGVEQVHPAGEARETKDVPAGRVSTTCTDVALPGPAFVRVIV